MKKLMMKHPVQLIIFLIVMMVAACKKQDDFLAVKPDQSLVVPGSLADYQALLNNTNVFNSSGDPALGEISADDFYVLPAVLNIRTATERNTYLWTKQIYPAGAAVLDWNNPYSEVWYANTVLDGLARLKINPGQQTQYNQIRGAALFFRGYAFYNLVQTFAMPYDAQTAGSDPGIPLRLTSDLNEKSIRATVKASYDQVLADLSAALPLLPGTSAMPTNPTKAAANAMLARVSLAMSNYGDALKYATTSLNQFGTLVDFNMLTAPTASALNNAFLAEDIFHASLRNYTLISNVRNTVIDSALYAAYSGNDLRRTKFFAKLSGFQRFVGSYDYKGYKFSGLATDEVYLIRAECYARTGNVVAAMNDLNTLLVNRWKTNTFVPYTAVSADDALSQILSERRKELVFRGLRWTDLRRLNKEDKFKLTLQRNVSGTAYNQPPNDPRYALPIPDAEITISGLPQNIR
jgi:hypothetical protein